MQTRKRSYGWMVLAAVLVLWLSGSLAFAQAQPPGPVVKYQFRTAGLPQPARFNIAQNVLNFDAGAATPFHRHPGQVLVTVLYQSDLNIRHGWDILRSSGKRTDRGGSHAS